MKDRDIKLNEIKKHNPSLYQDVLDKKVKLQDAYNETMMKLTDTSEYKGRGTRSKNLPTLDKEIERIMKSHHPSLEDLLNSIKKQFVFTWEAKLKDYLEK
jgi:hypothetical protein